MITYCCYYACQCCSFFTTSVWNTAQMCVFRYFIHKGFNCIFSETTRVWMRLREVPHVCFYKWTNFAVAPHLKINVWHIIWICIKSTGFWLPTLQKWKIYLLLIFLFMENDVYLIDYLLQFFSQINRVCGGAFRSGQRNSIFIIMLPNFYTHPKTQKQACMFDKSAVLNKYHI